MITVEVYSYEENGIPVMDYVIVETGEVFPLDRSESYAEAKRTAKRVTMGAFFSCQDREPTATLEWVFKFKEGGL